MTGGGAATGGGTATHPAVASAARAAGRGAVAAGATVVAQAAAKASGARQPNHWERTLRALYPGGEMDAVSVLPWGRNPNPVIRRGGGPLFGAWTNSSTLVYVQDSLTKGALLTTYVLFHESLHVLQFAKAGIAYPKSFEAMLDAEKAAYPQTEAWVTGAAGPRWWPAPAQLKAVRAAAAAATKDVQRVSTQASAAAAAARAAGTDVDRAHLDVLVATQGLPAFGSVGGVAQAYTIRDLYTQDAAAERSRWKALGY